MLNRLSALILCLIFGLGLYAEDDFVLTFKVKDRIHRHAMCFKVNLYEWNDSLKKYDYSSTSYGDGQTSITFHPKPKSKQYALTINPALYDEEQNRYFTTTKREYEEIGFIIDLPDNATSPYELPDFLMDRTIRHELKEVSVAASKVMFYFDKDTLMFNADAFVLADGSMLDALLNQLPGVELKDDGQIICNGRKIENLLINGRDVFNGKQGLMLENLAAYTVKNIAVYDKRGRTGELMERDAGDNQYVMDVRLKKHYSHGWIVNADAGYGTRRKYLGKLFGMWFSDNISMTAYASSNNLSDNKVPGKNDGSWSYDNMSSGVEQHHNGGLTYNAVGYDDKWEIKGDVGVNGSISTQYTKNLTESYLTNNNLYFYSWNDINREKLEFSTAHDLFLN